MQEDELKRLVSEGEIRAFRDQDMMKFKKEDVERFKRDAANAGAETLDEELPEELVFDEDDADQEVGMATAAITDDSFLEEEDVPLDLEEEPATGRRGSRGGSRRPRASAGGGAKRKPRVVVEGPEETEGPVWTVAIALSTVVALIGVFVALDAIQGVPSGMTQWVADSLGGMFGG